MENEVSKLDSPWWNIQICLKNSEWIAENVKGVDQSVKEMLKLIEHDEDLPMEKVDSNYLKQPELIARIKEISDRHHLLADHYKKLTGELSGYIQSANDVKNYEKTTFGTQLSTPFLTPVGKLRMHNVEGQVVVGSDISPSSGGGISDTTANEGSDSSLLSSDSDSESCNSSPNERSNLFSPGKMVKHGVVEECGEYEILRRRISDYEKELQVSNEKFQFAEEEIAKLKSELQNNEVVVAKMGSIEAQLLSAENQIKLHESELEKENRRSLMLQRKIVDLEAQLEAEKTQVHELNESVKRYTAELSDCDLEIKKLNAELQDASGNFALEKWQLESSISKLSENLTFHEARTEELEMQCESLADQIKKCEAEKVSMERNHEDLKINWHDDIERVKVELSKKIGLVNTLNENLDGLKLKYDMLMAEKDGVYSKLQTLSADKSVRDDENQRLEHNVHELHSENKELKAELKSRIDELEKEVGKKVVMISDMAEEKREAIRQLCFSLDHFRSAYVELREACVARKWSEAVVS